MEKISKQTLQRLPMYLTFLKQRLTNSLDTVSATVIAQALGLNHVQVRKDLAAVSTGGKPKTGYITHDLISQIENFLGYNDCEKAVIVGAGRLGKALISYEGFRNYGLDIIAAFDKEVDIINKEISGKPIFSMELLKKTCIDHGVKIGIITVPVNNAQAVCDLLTNSGIKAVWNFAPVHLQVPEGVLVQNENMAASLAVLSKHLKQKNKQNKSRHT